MLAQLLQHWECSSCIYPKSTVLVKSLKTMKIPGFFFARIGKKCISIDEIIHQANDASSAPPALGVPKTKSALKRSNVLRSAKTLHF